MMFNKYTASAAVAFTMAAAPLSAASIELDALGLELGTSIATASGGVFFDAVPPLLTSDDPVDPLLLDGAPGAIQFSFSGDPFLDTALIDFDDPTGFSTNQREFAIVDSGDDEANVLQFLLEEFFPGFGDLAFMTVTFDDTLIDFSGTTPFDVFDDLTAYSVDVEVFELNSVAAVPLPAGILLLGSALAGLGFAGARRKRA